MSPRNPHDFSQLLQNRIYQNHKLHAIHRIELVKDDYHEISVAHVIKAHLLRSHVTSAQYTTQTLFR